MTLTDKRTACKAEQERPQALPTKPDGQPVSPETVLRAVRRDCQLEPTRYLEEVRVPFGGE
jgi:hypothetical protein